MYSLLSFIPQYNLLTALILFVFLPIMSTSFTKHQIELLVNTRHKHASLFETRNSIDLCKAWDIVCSELKFEQTKANIRRKYSGLLDSYKKSKRNNRLFEYAYLFENKVEMDERGKVQLMDESSDDGNQKMKRKGKLGVDETGEKINDSKDKIEQNNGSDNGIIKSIKVLDSDQIKKKTNTRETTNDNEIKKKKDSSLHKKPRINKKIKHIFNSQRPAKQKNEEFTEISADHEKGYHSTIDNNEDMLLHYNNALSSEHNNLSQNKNEESNAEEFDSIKNVESDVGDSIETITLTSKKLKTNVIVNEKKRASKNESSDKNYIKNAITNETKQKDKQNRLKNGNKDDNKNDKLHFSKKTKHSKDENQENNDKKYKFSDLSPEDNHKILKLYEDMLRQSRKNKIVNKQNENKINELDNNNHHIDEINPSSKLDRKAMFTTKDTGLDCHNNNSDTQLTSNLLHNNDKDAKLKTQEQDTSKELKYNNTAHSNEKNNTLNEAIFNKSNNIEQDEEKKRNIKSQQKDNFESCSTNKQENTNKLNKFPSNNSKVTYFEDEKADELAKSINKLNGNIALLIDVLKNHMQKQ